MFEPAKVIVKVRQPMLVVQPMLDREVPAYHGEQLAQLARSRPRAGATEFVQLTGVNHLLARATTGEIAEYGTLAAAEHQPGRNARADVVARKGACRRPRQSRCGFWPPMTRQSSLSTFRLPAGSVKTIGRSPGAQFIVEAALVSRLHCQLTATATSLQVKDLGSTNGTFVNGKRVKTAELTRGRSGCRWAGSI